MEHGVAEQDQRVRVPERPVTDPEPSGAAPATGLVQRGLLALRPLLFAGAAGLVVLAIHALAVRAGVSPRSGRTEYGLHTAALVVAALAVLAVWWARRRGQSWDADLLPALFGGLAALTLLTALHGTPFDANGLQGDQTFRTAIVTRFADSWRLADYTYRDLPAYYAPGFFWLLGRAADLAGVAPWKMLKYGLVAVGFLTPLISYLLWRRLVPVRVAALISAVPLVVPELYESYGWLVLVAIVPWWLEAVHGLTRPGLRPRHPVVLGLIGAVLFCVYYYYFFVFVIVFALFLAVQRWRGEFSWRLAGRGLGVLAIAAVGASPYWAPLAWNFLTAPQFESLNNRWITLNSGDLALPMLSPSVLGALCLFGLGFLVVTLREALSRSLLIVFVSLYVWHALGWLLAAVDMPLMSFRAKALVPVVLLAGAALGLVRLTRYAVERLPAPAQPQPPAPAQPPAPDGGGTATRTEQFWRVVALGGVLLAVFATDRFVTTVVDDDRIRVAHDETFPDGRLPGFHDEEAKPELPAAEAVRSAISARYRGAGHPVVLSDRANLFAFYPYYGFGQWTANYSHPTARYHDRLDFLDEVARAGSPAEFAVRTADNPYDRIDVLVLRIEKDDLIFHSSDDAFPFGTKSRTVRIPARLIGPEHFDSTTIDGYLVAVRRP
ncbi:galactan 5-O-arabinofuranosyltransferase [Plantactinospora mayteni]|uniref:Galactan 5-O-arabinofuranosyltransferase n=1 Tax=Plantactinospora mayteni TaxID=566021 RepID=A0ABQ4EQU6_9ACTN|nr:arabinofuranosyltransferase [Plantactinospora mayteni]GIG97019.1 arabinofuranosyltransferase AftA [Plantactinospora mayteni]